MRRGGLTMRQGCRVQGHMEMDAPLVVARRLGEGDIEILVATKRSFLRSRNDLVQLGVVGKTPEPFATYFVGHDLEGGTQMNFADADAFFLQRGDGICGLFIFHGQMTGVVIDAEESAEALVARSMRLHLLEEANGFGARFP